MIAYAGRDFPFFNPRLRKGDPLPGWMRHEGMLGFLRRWLGPGAVIFEACAPAAPAPPAAAPVPRTEAEQKEASWKEWIETKERLRQDAGGGEEEQQEAHDG